MSGGNGQEATFLGDFARSDAVKPGELLDRPSRSATLEQRTSDDARHPSPSTGYRRDIDGLRAVAVLSVVLFHSRLPGFSGGFIGVDVFFVISGFLIGDQIHRQAGARRFSFVEFYARRARRILPALFVMLALLYLLGLLVLTPLELSELGRSAVPTVLGVSNLLFYRAGDYFAPAADSNPLLMTWSLGLEEQFYLVLPVLMILLIRARIPLLPALSLLCLLSFGGSILLTEKAPAAAFYLLPTRAWELGIGTMLAVAQARGVAMPLRRPAREVLAAVALLTLVAAVMLYRPAIPFPGWFALIPTLATLTLMSVRTSFCNDVLLGGRVMNLLGKISYSWYLWHWPVFYFGRILSDDHHAAKSAALILLSAVLGFLSWRYVETPLRRRVLSSRTALLRYGVVAGVVAGGGLILYLTMGLPQRLPAAAKPMAQAAQEARDFPCLTRHGSRDLPQARVCLPPMEAGQTERLLVLGDSHASALAPGFAQVAARKGWAFGTLTKGSCLPLWDYALDMRDKVKHWGDCIAFEDKVFDYVMRHPEVTHVVLAGFWSAGDRTVRRRSVEKRGGKLPPVDFTPALSETIHRLQGAGKRVILVADAPLFSIDPYAIGIGRTMPIRALLSDLLGGSSAHGVEAAPQRDPTRGAIADLAKRHPGVLLVDPWPALCAGGQCRFSDGRQIYYWDWQHLTTAGARAALAGPALPRELR